MRHRTSHIPRVFRIKQSVGLCGKMILRTSKYFNTKLLTPDIHSLQAERCAQPECVMLTR